MEWLVLVAAVVYVVVLLALMKWNTFKYYNEWYNHGVKDRETGFYFTGIETVGAFLRDPYKDGYNGAPRRTSWLNKNKREV